MVIPFVGVACVVNYDERATGASKHTTSQNKSTVQPGELNLVKLSIECSGS